LSGRGEILESTGLPGVVASIILTERRTARRERHAESRGLFSAVTALGAIQELDVDAMRLLTHRVLGEDFYN